MKLNPDCIRDVLLFLEDNLLMGEYYCIKSISISSIISGIAEDFEYEMEDIAYSIVQLMDAKYISGYKNYNGSAKKLYGEIDDITWEGHNFLNTIRSNTIWETTKGSAKKLGISSIRGLGSLASMILNAIISNPEYIKSIISTIPK